MIFKLFVKDLGDRVLHIARIESSWKGNYIARIGKVKHITILSILCDDGQYLANLVGTLETDRNTRVIAAKDGSGNYIDLKHLYKAKNEPQIDSTALHLIEEGIEIAS